MFRHESRRKTLRLAIVGLLAVALVAVMASEAPARRSPFEPLSIFARALAYIELAYVEPIDQEILALRHYEQLSRAETAQVLGIEVAAASKRYLRALKRLQSILEENPASKSGCDRRSLEQ